MGRKSASGLNWGWWAKRAVLKVFGLLTLLSPELLSVSAAGSHVSLQHPRACDGASEIEARIFGSSQYIHI
jgi:hypothetical protein